MHLVILATEHQLQIPILLAYPLVADELFSLDRLRCGATDLNHLSKEETV